MNIFAQIGSSSILVGLLAAAIYIFGPSSNCDRLANASNVAHIMVGALPKLGELASGRSLDKYWVDVEDLSIASHKWLVGYFEVPGCTQPQFTFYQKSGQGDTESWLEKFDPELKKLGEQAAEN